MYLSIPWCLEGSTPTIKIGPSPFVACPLYDDFNISPHLFAPPSLVNKITMTRHYT